MYKKLVVFTLCLFVMICSANVYAIRNDRAYHNKKFKVSLNYPSNWKRNPSYYERYDGEDGFFSVGAFGGEEMKLEDAVIHIVSHKLKPYGTKPIVKNIMIDGQKAKLILPGRDAPLEGSLSTVVVKYPFGSVRIDDYTYSYFLLNADKNHIMSIAKTIKFTNEES